MTLVLPKWASEETASMHEAFIEKLKAAKQLTAETEQQAAELRASDIATVRLPSPELRLQAELRAASAELEARKIGATLYARLIDVDGIAECRKLAAAFLQKRTEVAEQLFALGFDDYATKNKGRVGLDFLFRNSAVRGLASAEGMVRIRMEALRGEDSDNEGKIAALKARIEQLTAGIKDLLLV